MAAVYMKKVSFKSLRFWTGVSEKAEVYFCIILKEVYNIVSQAGDKKIGLMD